MLKIIVLAVMLSFASVGLQACFYDSSPDGQTEHYTQDQSHHTLCDANGNNCAPCDANNNCQATTTRSSWGFFF
jgi:hypothetical protein